jgi:hypothetical protein
LPPKFGETLPGYDTLELRGLALGTSGTGSLVLVRLFRHRLSPVAAFSDTSRIDGHLTRSVTSKIRSRCDITNKRGPALSKWGAWGWAVTVQAAQSAEDATRRTTKAFEVAFHDILFMVEARDRSPAPSIVPLSRLAWLTIRCRLRFLTDRRRRFMACLAPLPHFYNFLRGRQKSDRSLPKKHPLFGNNRDRPAVRKALDDRYIHRVSPPSHRPACSPVC